MKKFITYFKQVRGISRDPFFKKGETTSVEELSKTGSRTEVINKLLRRFNRPTTYLEIGVRDPEDNFVKISSEQKFSVDPGFEVQENKADFPCTSDVFFRRLKSREWKGVPDQFDLIFIDGLHTAEQADRDIANSLEILAEGGFIVMHDCNPPTEWHAREEFRFGRSPAGKYWNGTSWKAFLKWRKNKDVYSCCVDTDWGVGIISKKFLLGKATSLANEFYEYKVFEAHRKEFLNLLTMEEFTQLINR
jgi:SAM-dependent methyltransferase